MKMNFKQIGLAAAVAAVAAGYASVASAQPTRTAGNVGDLAIVPYYTVQDDWVTGVHIINTSDATQVLKLRLRRASDSADALDFNIILSPKDEWTGNISDSTGTVVFQTDDNSCTAPLRANGDFPMPNIFALGAEEGYLEVISMGQPADENQPIAIAAKHAAGVPADCGAVASNFFRNIQLNAASTTVESPFERGNRGNELTNQSAAAGVAAGFAAAGATCFTSTGVPITPADVTLAGICENDFVNADPNSLAVSYFMRDASTGIEMGGNAVHISGFSDNPWMSNQETGLFSGDVFGFDFPDLNGGPFDDTLGVIFPLITTPLRGAFEELRNVELLGSTNLLNDWSVASARNVSTDWVVTFPGQYAMLDYLVWVTQGFSVANCGTPANAVTGAPGIPLCDFRDIPVVADLTLYDREEGVITPESGDLVISPAPPGTTNTLLLPNEVNVIEWTDGSNAPVLSSSYVTTVDPSVLGDFGWASLSVSSGTKVGGNRICLFDAVSPADTGLPRGDDAGGVTADSVCQPIVANPAAPAAPIKGVPMVGFVAWERSFPQNPDGNYGRLIQHSIK